MWNSLNLMLRISPYKPLANRIEIYIVKNYPLKQ